MDPKNSSIMYTIPSDPLYNQYLIRIQLFTRLLIIFVKIVLASITIIAIAGITMSTIMASGQDYNIPDWIKNNAAWWADGQIPDSAFVNGIKFLIENGIMEIESSQSSSQTSEVSNFQDNGDFYLVYDNVGSEWQSYEE